MIRPNKNKLAPYSPGESIWQATSIHPNPRFFKYRWQIYTADSPWEGPEFFEKAPRFSIYEAMTLIEKLRDTAQTHIVYNQRLPRSGPGVPFDPESER